MFTRWIYIVLAIAVLALAPVVGAQTDQTSHVICGDLAEADCQILRDNKTVMDAVSSFAFGMSMTLDYAGLDDSYAMSLSVDGQGGFAIAPEALAGVLALEEQLNNSSGLSLPEDAIAQLDAFIAGLTGEIRADIQLAADGESSDIPLHLLMKDGVIVFGAGALGELMDQPMEGMDWIGLDANGMMSLLASDPDMTDLLGIGAEQELPADAGSWADVEEAATTITRLADSEVNGLAVAVFESSLEMNHFADMVVEAYQGTTALDAAEIAAMRQQLENATLNMRQSIGLSDHYTYRTELSMEMDGASEMSMALILDQSDFNEPVIVEIPQDAFILPLAMMMQMGN
ncbi:MAG: hypothetical protein OXI40_16790 [Chloroflexota bacterium]|nr:hypothetical protein [Chloroflexota bacterium]